WGILSNSAHPGATRTNLQTTGPNKGKNTDRPELMRRLTMKIPGMWQPPPQGALPTLLAATGTDAVGGAFYGPDSFMNMNGMPTINRSPRRSLDEATATQLWSISEQ